MKRQRPMQNVKMNGTERTECFWYKWSYQNGGVTKGDLFQHKWSKLPKFPTEMGLQPYFIYKSVPVIGSSAVIGLPLTGTNSEFLLGVLALGVYCSLLGN